MSAHAPIPPKRSPSLRESLFRCAWRRPRVSIGMPMLIVDTRVYANVYTRAWRPPRAPCASGLRWRGASPLAGRSSSRVAAHPAQRSFPPRAISSAEATLLGSRACQVDSGFVFRAESTESIGASREVDWSFSDFVGASRARACLLRELGA